MKIEITQEDIDNGVRLHECRCPIALAVKRAYRDQGQSILPSVITRYVFRMDGELRLPALKLPPEAQEFMHRFDGHELVHPFTFEAEEVREG